MDKNYIVTLAVLVSLVAGFGGGYAMRGAQISDGYHMMPMGGMMQDNGMGMDSAMEGMMAGLQGKTGDEFDKAFLSGMIMHHQGAVQMAQAALQNAKHQEIKDIALAIISAQTSEITEMQAWGKSWYNQ
jgi:uncharacterized protein (DUF305 family)